MQVKKIIVAAAVYTVLTIAINAQIVEPLYKFGSLEYQKSLELYNEGILRKAENQLIHAINNFPLAPSYDRALLLESEMSLFTGNSAIAEHKLDEFIMTHPNSPLRAFAAIQRGYIAYEHKNYENACSLFEKSEEISFEDFKSRNDSLYLTLAENSLYWKGNALAKLGKYKEARLIFEDYLKKYPNGSFADDALFALGLICEYSGQYSLAINYYSTVWTKYQYSNSSLGSKIREINNRLIMRDAPTALLSIESADNLLNHIKNNDSIGMKYEPQSYTENADEELLYLRGEAYNISNNYNKAIPVFKDFCEKYPDSKLKDYAMLGEAWALMNTGENFEAMKYYNKVIAGKEEGTETRAVSTARLYRAVVLKKQGNTEDAQKEFSSMPLIPSFPYSGEALLELGQIYYESGDYDNAARTLERADREANDALISIRINLLLGASYLEQRKFNNAYTSYKSAEQLALKSSEQFVPQKNMFIQEARLKQGIALVEDFRDAEAIQPLLAFISDNKNGENSDEATFWLSEAYFRSDMLKNAAQSYKSILDLYPKSIYREESYYGLGWSYFRQKDFQKSSAAFAEMIKEFPNSKFAVEVLAREGDGYCVNHNFKEAAAAYRKAALIDPNTEEGQYSAYQLCYAQYREGVYEDAFSSSINFVRKYPKSPYAPSALYLNAWIRFQEKKYSEAIDDFKYLIQAYPSSDLTIRAYYAIGDANYNLGNYDEALSSYKTIIETYPSNQLAPEALKSIQQCLVSLGRDTEAIQIADQFINTNPSSPFASEFKFKKAEMFYTGRKYNDAITEYDSFLNKYPDSEKAAEALYWMGKSYINMNEPAKAENVFNSLQKKYPESDYAPQGLLESGLMEKDLGNMQKADTIFSRLQMSYPEHQSSAQAGFERAVIRYNLGDTLGAVELFQKTASYYPNLEFGLQSRLKVGMYYRFKNLNDSARIEFGKLAMNTISPILAAEGLFRIGELWMWDGKFDKAVVSFQQVIDQYAGNEDWYSLSLQSCAECYEKLDESEKAKEIYKTLESLRPDDDFGKNAKNKLKTLK